MILYLCLNEEKKGTIPLFADNYIRYLRPAFRGAEIKQN